MKKHCLYLLLLFTIVSCSQEIDFPQPKPQNPRYRDPSMLQEKRTLLVYIALNNSLSSEIQDIHNALKEGWDAKTMGSLIILSHSRDDNGPMLLKFREQNKVTVIDTLKRYPNRNSASAELMSQVIADAKSFAPSVSYGMVLFSHASGWLPAKSYINPLAWEATSPKSSQITSYSIFEDNGREMELAAFASAIPDGTFDFIASEMCFMSGVEIAYALRNKTDFLLASAPEVLSPGFTPIYKTSLGLLYKPEADLQGFGQAFFDYFNGLQGDYKSAVISLVKTSEMDALAALTREISLPELSKEVINQIQPYDGNYRPSNWPHLFFDFGDYMSHIASHEQYLELTNILDKAVIYKRNTAKLINIPIAKHSGLSIYIPQASLPRLNKAYEETEWWKAVQN